MRTPLGKLAVWCPCCSAFLAYVTDLTTGPDGNLTTARPPNLRPSIEARSMRFSDDVCGYDHVLLADLRPREATG